MKKILLIMCVCLISLTGCGGGGDTQAPPPTVSTSAAGIWFGTMTDDTNTSYIAYGILSTAGEMRLYNYDTEVGYVGTVTTTASSGTGIVSAYTPDGYVWSTGSPVLTGSVSFDYVEKTSLSGSYTSSIENGTFALQYLSDYEDPSPLSLLQGSWGAYDSSTGISKSITIQADGTFTGDSNNGCIFNGSVATVNPQVNSYQVQINVTGCGQSTYNGLAYFNASTAIDIPNSFYSFTSNAISFSGDTFFKQ